MRECVVVPTGDEIVSGVIVDTNGPAISAVVRSCFPDCHVTVLPAVPDSRNAIRGTAISCAECGADLVILTGGSGGGQRFDPSLAVDCTHDTLFDLLNGPFVRELYGSNGHLWARLVAGTLRATTFLNVPGPYAEAVAAAEAVVRSIGDCGRIDAQRIVDVAASAVLAQYPVAERGR